MKEVKYQSTKRFSVSRIHVFPHASKLAMKHKMNQRNFEKTDFIIHFVTSRKCFDVFILLF